MKQIGDFIDSLCGQRKSTNKVLVSIWALFVKPSKQKTIVNWSDAIFATKKFWLLHVPVELFACPDLIEFQQKSICYQIYACKINKPTEMFVSRILGGHHPQTLHYNFAQIAKNPQNGTIGLFLFGDGNFAMVDTSGITNETTYELSAQEQPSILDMETAPCQGTAGGRFWQMVAL